MAARFCSAETNKETLEIMNKILRSFFALSLFSFALGMGAQTSNTKWREVHKVKKKETIFGIAKANGLTIEELIKANPEMNKPGYELKKDDYIFIPYPSSQTSAKPAASVGTKTTSQTSSQTPATGTIRVGVMLPLHNVDGDGRRMVEYYRGMLLAIDQLRLQGYHIDVRAWNVPQDADIRSVLLQEGADKCQLIFGPLYSSMVAPLADFCKAYGVKMIIPFSITGNEVAKNPNIFQVYQPQAQLTQSAIRAFVDRFSQYHAVFIDCNDANSDKGTFTFPLREQLEIKHIDHSITNLNSSDAMFAKAFSTTKPNVVVLNTGRSPQLNAAFAKLAKLSGVRISLYGYTEWLMYEKYDLQNFCKYDTYIPSTFYYNGTLKNTRTIETNYRTWFKADMMEALPRFALTGYDQAMFFIRGYHEQGKNFTGAKGTLGYKALQSPLNFRKVGKGGYQNESFMLVHYTRSGNIESINY